MYLCMFVMSSLDFSLTAEVPVVPPDVSLSLLVPSGGSGESLPPGMIEKGVESHRGELETASAKPPRLRTATNLENFFLYV